MNHRAHENKLCLSCNTYTLHWKELGRPEWHCEVCGAVFVPNKGRVR